MTLPPLLKFGRNAAMCLITGSAKWHLTGHVERIYKQFLHEAHATFSKLQSIETQTASCSDFYQQDSHISFTVFLLAANCVEHLLHTESRHTVSYNVASLCMPTHCQLGC